VYLRNDISDQYDEFQFEVEAALRRQFGLKDPEVREIDTAVFQSLLNRLSPEDVAREVVRQRGYSPDRDQ